MNVRDQLIGFLASATALDPATIPADASMESFPAWDSLAQMNVCLMIQDEFGFEIEIEEISDNTSLEALVALIGKRRGSHAA